MITDIFVNRYPELDIGGVNNSFFVQLFNLYDDYYIGIHGSLMDKITDYPYSEFADEHIRLISQTQKKLCNELGYSSLDKPQEYLQPDWGYNEYRIFKNYVFDKSIDPLEKLSFFEVLFRDTEQHLQNELVFLKKQIPIYKVRSKEITELSKAKGIKYHDDGAEKLVKANQQLEDKKRNIDCLRTTFNQRLKNHKLLFSYHNGYLQNSTDPLIENKIKTPFWDLIAEPKFKNVETDMLQA